MVMQNRLCMFIEHYLISIGIGFVFVKQGVDKMPFFYGESLI